MPADHKTSADTGSRIRRWQQLAAGHYWSFAPLAQWLARPSAVPESRPWHTSLDDAQLGPIRLSGAWQQLPRNAKTDTQADTAVVVVHGLGGDQHSHYMQRAAIAAAAQGVDCLRLNLRGADMSGEDLYHAGLTADLRAALASPELSSYKRLLLLGYSLGGHLVLRYASEASTFDRRVSAVAAVCPPLDLARSAVDIDSALRWPYRRYVMASLRRMLHAVAARRALPIPLRQAMQIRKVSQWDEQIVAPRHGFANAAEYYERASVATRLAQLQCPSLVVLAQHDPMVLTRSVMAALTNKPEQLQLRVLQRAGHVGFPNDTYLAQEAPTGFESQALGWLLQPQQPQQEPT